MSQTKVEKPEKKRFKMPNVIVIMLFLILVACLFTYIIPAGQFDMNEEGNPIPGTYGSIEQDPVIPIDALNLILDGGVQASTVIVLLLFMGGFFGAIFQLDSIPNIINYLVYKYKNIGAMALSLGLFTLMGFIGFFIGGDMMIVFVTLGVIMARQLRLDPISALAMTFLAPFIGFSFCPSCYALAGQVFARDVSLY